MEIGRWGDLEIGRHGDWEIGFLLSIMNFSLFSIRFFSKITRTDEKWAIKNNCTQRVIIILSAFLIYRVLSLIFKLLYGLRS